MSGKCVVCLGTLRDRYLHAHAKCLYEAIYFMRDGFAGAPVSSPLVQKLAPVCYLCGENETTDAEHIYPWSKGGDPGWPNIGGACSNCNMSKGTKVGISKEAEERWRQQQEVFKAAAARCIKRGDLLYHDLLASGVEWNPVSSTDPEKGYWRSELVEYLSFKLWILYFEEDRDYDPEALAEEVIDSWLETPAGQQFNLFDRDQC